MGAHVDLVQELGGKVPLLVVRKMSCFKELCPEFEKRSRGPYAPM